MEMLLGIMWMIMSLLVITQYLPQCKGLKGIDLFIVFIVLAVGGPIFVASTALETLLSYLLPEGWNDDDDEFKRH